MKKQYVFLFGLLGAFLFVSASILGGLQIEGYSFIGQYISESFASGLPNTGYLRLMYVISGLFLFGFGLTAPSVFPKAKALKVGFWLFAFFYALGTIIVAIFPCDLGCPTEVEVSSLAQLIHNTSAFFTYIVTPPAVIYIGGTLKKWPPWDTLSKVSLICGSTALVFVVFLFMNPNGPYIGLLQRLIETCLLGWVGFTSFYIRKTENPFT